MNLRKLVNDYVECDKFEIQVINDKIKIFYYDSVESFSSKKIVVSKNNKNFCIKGKNLVIETMFTEYLVISGDIFLIELGLNDE